MSITTVLDSADDQCRMPVTLGSRPASTGVAGEDSFSSSSAVVPEVPSIGGTAAVAGGGVDAVAGCVACVATADATEPALARAERARWPRVHHTPAPQAAATNTTAATTARPGRE